MLADAEDAATALQQFGTDPDADPGIPEMLGVQLTTARIFDTADFVYETEHAITPAALHNGVNEAFANGNFGVFDLEGGNGLDFVSAKDIRVQGDSGLGADNNTESWFPNKYPGFDSSIPTADYTEAHLIIAESELQAGAFGPMTDRLNALRDVVGLDSPAARGNFTDATDLLGDLRRLIREYGRDPEAVFPTGSYYKGSEQ